MALSVGDRFPIKTKVVLRHSILFSGLLSDAPGYDIPSNLSSGSKRIGGLGQERIEGRDVEPISRPGEPKLHPSNFTPRSINIQIGQL
jgi:hypothetical protein